MKSLVKIVSVALTLVFAACGGFSDREQEMVGSYYISEISDIEPIYELNSDGTARTHAIRPGVVSYWVEGEWKVSGGKLIIKNDTTKIHVNGDRQLVGHVAEKIEREIVEFNGTTLKLNDNGLLYVYHRRPELHGQDTVRTIDIGTAAHDLSDDFVDESELGDSEE